jgi:hypothetical protein
VLPVANPQHIIVAIGRVLAKATHLNSGTRASDIYVPESKEAHATKTPILPQLKKRDVFAAYKASFGFIWA